LFLIISVPIVELVAHLRGLNIPIIESPMTPPGAVGVIASI